MTISETSELSLVKPLLVEAFESVSYVVFYDSLLVGVYV
jgi:hypothetical protein